MGRSVIISVHVLKKQHLYLFSIPDGLYPHRDTAKSVCRGKGCQVCRPVVANGRTSSVRIDAYGNVRHAFAPVSSICTFQGHKCGYRFQARTLHGGDKRMYHEPAQDKGGNRIAWQSEDEFSCGR